MDKEKLKEGFDKAYANAGALPASFGSGFNAGVEFAEKVAVEEVQQMKNDFEAKSGIEKTTEKAKSIIALLNKCEYMEFFVSQDGTKILEIDNFEFEFDKDGNLKETKLSL